MKAFYICGVQKVDFDQLLSVIKIFYVIFWLVSTNVLHFKPAEVHLLVFVLVIK